MRGLKQIAVDNASSLSPSGPAYRCSSFTLRGRTGAGAASWKLPDRCVSGHLTGGGHGLLARSHGLTCDALEEATLVDAQARVLHANALKQQYDAGIYSTTPRACHSASPPHESQSVLTNSICAHRERNSRHACVGSGRNCSYCMCWPPLIAILAPVTNAASSEHR